jgi:predicted nucleotidyltransferase
MDTIELHPDFKDFLRLLNSHGVEYLLVGGYAVGYHGYPRATGDMDIWIAVSEANAQKAAMVLRDFGMPKETVSQDLFLDKDRVIRMGVPPVRIEVITGASGVSFLECYSRREVVAIDGILLNFISLEDLKVNKKAAARHKDLEDLEHLP